MIIETCPKCGSDLFASVIYTQPPINCMDCPSCGWHWESKPELIERVPFNEKKYEVSIVDEEDYEIIEWAELPEVNNENCRY